MGISKKSILGFAKGVVELAERLDKIIKEAEKEKKEVIIVAPTRGAFMPVASALYSLRFIGRYQMQHPLRLARSLFGPFVRRTVVRVLPVPSTADTGRNSIIPQYLSPSQREVFEDGERLFKGLKRGSVKLLSYLLRGEREAPLLRSFLELLRMEGNGWLADEYARFSAGDATLVYVDTAISGRSAAGFLEAAREEKIQMIPLILADKRGAELQGEYKETILSYAGAEEEEEVFIPTADIVTENRGSAIQGIWAVLYPQLIADQMRSFGYSFGGTWSPLSRRKEHLKVYWAFSLALTDALERAMGRHSYLDNSYDKFNFFYNWNRRVIERRIFRSRELIRLLGFPARTFRRTAVKENGRRVIHVHFPRDVWKRMGRRFVA
ncbi:MAG: hypothetical protein GXO00_02335 [Candidatus Diapherotrites archaeon]|nr:hypothetical protein [Candidatus Diapherotrites archaeon]